MNKEKYAFAYTEHEYNTYTHKGNCKFCKERRKKEFYEMVDVLFNTEEQWTKEN